MKLIKKILWIPTSYAKYALQAFVSRIRSGPLKGKRWIIASSLKCFRGVFEPHKIAAIQRATRPGDVVYDVGAHVGYCAMTIADIVGPSGRVIAFEPHPLNAGQLRRHVSMNSYTNITIYESCVGDRRDDVRFYARGATGASHVSSRGNVQVPMMALDDLYSRGEIPLPDFVKIDVEGSELMVLQGAKTIIESARPLILLATHSEQLDQECRRFLGDRDYRMQNVGPFDGDQEVIAEPLEKPLNAGIQPLQADR